MGVIAEAEMVIMQIKMDSRTEWVPAVYLNRTRAQRLIEGRWTRDDKLSYEAERPSWRPSRPKKTTSATHAREIGFEIAQQITILRTHILELFTQLRIKKSRKS